MNTRPATRWSIAATVAVALCCGLGNATAQWAVTPDIPLRTLRLIQLYNTNLCVQRDPPVSSGGPVLSSKSMSLQVCDKGRPDQMFYIFEPEANLDLRLVVDAYTRGRIVPALREIADFASDHVVGTSYGVPDSMIVLGAKGESPAGPTPIPAPPADALWEFALEKGTGKDLAYFLANPTHKYCLSFVGHQVKAGTQVVAGECNKDFDLWMLPPTITR